MPRNKDCPTGNLLDYLHQQTINLLCYKLNYKQTKLQTITNYKLIGVDLSKQTNTIIPQQISFVEKLEEDDGAAMFFVCGNQQKAILNFSLGSLI